MEFTNKEKVNAEMAIRSFCKEAEEAERGISPLYIYEKETDEGKKYFIRGVYEYDNLTFKELEQFFIDEYYDSHITKQEMDALVSYMGDDIREKVHLELAPCTNEEFLIRYMELDSNLEEVMEQQFSVALGKLDLSI